MNESRISTDWNDATEDVDNHLYKDLYEKAVDLLVKTKLELEQIKMENA